MITDTEIRCIIVTFNGEQYITRCLNSLKKSVPESKIIVVDNGSSDKTVKTIDKNYPGIALIRLNKNYGFGWANNMGIELAIKQGAEYILLLNQDVYVEDDTIQVLVTMAKFNPQYAILSPIHLNGKGLEMDYHFSTYVSRLLISDCYFNNTKDLYPCGFVNAATWLISKESIQKIGGFDPLFFHYGEDNDYINRVKYHDMLVGVCTKTRIIHDRGPFNAFNGYTEARRKYIETLKGLKNINYNFHYVLKVTFMNFFCDAIFSFFTLNFKSLGAIIQVSAKTLYHLNKIKIHRAKSKGEAAFLK